MGPAVCAHLDRRPEKARGLHQRSPNPDKACGMERRRGQIDLTRPLNAPAGQAGAELVHGRRLELCSECGSDLVQGLHWAPVDMRRWRIELWCPDCDTVAAGVCTSEELEHFEGFQGDAIVDLVEALRGLERVHMEEELARFRAALGAGLILPEDF